MILKKIIPLKFRNKIRSIKLLDNLFFYYYKLKINSIKKRLIGKDKLNVVFILMDLSMWKYEGLFKIMLNDNRFNPLILIAPRINQDNEDIKKDSLKMVSHFKSKNYKVFEGYDFNRKKWLDIKKNINPDIVFYTQPYNNVAVHKKYSLWNFKDSLFCYIPYFFPIISQKWVYDSLMQNIAWKLFYPTKFHIKTAKSFAKNKGSNVFITGYPIADEILDDSRIVLDPWLNKTKQIKRIIWAPHHSIKSDSNLSLSSFLSNYKLMFDLAAKYKYKIHIAFKPHPILLTNLYNHPDWGRERADAYYKKWQELYNGQLETGEYVDLMLTSDAMIHDSISFTVEYLYTKKPVLYLTKDNHSANLCEFGNLAFNQHYKGYSAIEIESFITNVILDDNDFMLEKRNMFFKDYLLPPNNQLVAKNVLSEILIGLR